MDLCHFFLQGCHNNRRDVETNSAVYSEVGKEGNGITVLQSVHGYHNCSFFF